MFFEINAINYTESKKAKNQFDLSLYLFQRTFNFKRLNDSDMIEIVSYLMVDK